MMFMSVMSVMYWPLIKQLLLNDYFHKKINLYASTNPEKTVNNIVSFVHSFSSIILNSLYFLVTSSALKDTFMKASFITSMSYFTYDALLITINKDKGNYPYIAHHMAAIVVLRDIFNSHNRDLLIYLYLLAEISNLPNFLVYHLLKCNPIYINEFLNKNMKYLRLFQVVWFSFFRVFVYSFYIKECTYNVDHNLTKLVIAFLFLTGAFWAKGQFVGVYRLFNIKTIKQLN